MIGKNLRIGTRLIGAFSLVLLLIITVGAAGYMGIRSVSGEALELLEHDADMTNHFSEIRALALDLRRYEKNMFIRIGSTDERAKKDFPKWNEQLAKLEKEAAELEKQMDVEKYKEPIKKIKEGVAKYAAGLRAIQGKIQSGELKTAAEADTALGAARDTMNGVNKLIEETSKEWENLISENAKGVRGHCGKIEMTILLFAAAALAVGIIASLLLYSSIMKPLRNMMQLVGVITEGDLTHRADVSSRDELGDMGRMLNTFIEKLNGIVGNLGESALHVAAAANETYATSSQMATAAEEVSAQAGTVATASEEMAATSTEIAENCNHAATSSKLATDSAMAGASVVQQTLQGMERITERVRESAKTVESLGTRSDQIGQIIGTIEDIADQTNLLALNAAIEAARAGEQGRGFAVVADEVRALAERTTKATKEISEMIKTIQHETKGAVSSMEEGVREVEKGSVEAQKSGQALQEILNQINELSMQVSQIATAAEQQTATTGEISTNIHEINLAVQHTVNGARESASAAGEMTKMAESLQDMVKFFKTSGNELVILDLAKSDHGLFVKKVEAAVNGETKHDADDLPNHHMCRFGKWYDGEGQHMCGSLSSFKAINTPHERIHALAKEAVSAANAGDRQRAAQHLREVQELSGKVNSLLVQIKEEHRRSSH